MLFCGTKLVYHQWYTNSIFIALVRHTFSSNTTYQFWNFIRNILSLLPHLRDTRGLTYAQLFSLFPILCRNHRYKQSFFHKQSIWGTRYQTSASQKTKTWICLWRDATPILLLDRPSLMSLVAHLIGAPHPIYCIIKDIYLLYFHIFIVYFLFVSQVSIIILIQTAGGWNFRIFIKDHNGNQESLEIMKSQNFN